MTLRLLILGAGLVAVAVTVATWAACMLSSRLSRDDIMGHYLDEY